METEVNLTDQAKKRLLELESVNNVILKVLEKRYILDNLIIIYTEKDDQNIRISTTGVNTEIKRLSEMANKTIQKDSEFQ